MTKTAEQTKVDKKNLMAKTKKEVFNLYRQTCLGRIQSAQISEMRKSWMVHDILKAQGYPVA